MGTEQRTKVPCDIDTLPDKLKLPSSYVKRLIKENKSQKDDKTLVQDEVVVRCQDENNNDFQLHLRAGMTDFVDKCLEERGLEILNSRFTINLTLREAGKGNVSVLNDNIQKDAGAPLLKHIRGCCTGETTINDAEEGTSTDLKTNDNNSCATKEHNSNIHVNALLLAILTQQRKSVECILKYICREIEKSQSICDQFQKVFSEKVQIQNVASVTPGLTHVTKYDSFLNNMNLFHLSCYYYPEAIQILQELCCSTDGGRAEYHLKQFQFTKEMVKQHNDERFKCTPLHIAAGKSNVKSARYVIA
jgi:hypothetical protein